jgi:hypothetical protein
MNSIITQRKAKQRSPHLLSRGSVKNGQDDLHRPGTVAGKNLGSFIPYPSEILEKYSVLCAAGQICSWFKYLTIKWQGFMTLPFHYPELDR